MQIRFATDDDTAAIADVLYTSFIEYESLYTKDGFAATAISKKQVQKRLNEGPVWVAFADGEVVGTVSAVRRGESLYVRGMCVAPQRRGQQLGELLLREVERYAKENGLARVFLSTTPFLDRASRLYKELGFHRCEEEPHDLYGTPLLTLEKLLDQ